MDNYSTYESIESKDKNCTTNLVIVFFSYKTSKVIVTLRETIR